MGIKDYEDFHLQQRGELDRLDYLLQNTSFIYYYMKYCVEHSPGEAFNRHCFKFTRLREEIYFINVKLVRPDNAYPANEYCFVVNEDSFWNRFHIYLEKSPLQAVTKYDGQSVTGILKKLIEDTQYAQRVVLTLFPSEIEKLNEIRDRLITPEQKAEFDMNNILNGSLCEFRSFRNYNKNIWAELFKNPVPNLKRTTTNTSSTIDAGLGDYKDPNSEMYYKPDDENYKDVMYLYL